MFPTFSVNASMLSKKETVRGVFSLINSIDDTPINREWIGEAFLKLVEGDGLQRINLSSYAQSCVRNDKINRLNRSEISLITQDEYESGYIGVTDIVAHYVEDNLDEIIANIDMDYYVEEFLKERKKIFLTDGHDLWRLIQLAKVDDKQSQKKLRTIMNKYNLREIIQEVLMRSACYSKLEGILC